MTKFCSNCGEPIADKAYICTKCGVKQAGVSDDKGGLGWFLLGFIIPIVGLILWLIWKDEKPETAKSVGQGALISFILGILLYVVAFIFLGAMMAV